MSRPIVQYVSSVVKADTCGIQIDSVETKSEHKQHGESRPCRRTKKGKEEEEGRERKKI